MESTQWLRQTLTSWYGLEVISFIKVRDAWRVETTSGPKCFKSVAASPARVEFTGAAVDHILNHGFPQTARFLKTVHGTFAVDLPEGVFYATEWLPGREGDFSLPGDIQAAARSLARFHLASQGFSAPTDSHPRVTWGKIPEDWRVNTDQLREFKTLAKARQAEPFSRLYLQHCPLYIQRAETAQEILRNCNYESLVQTAKDKSTLCHHDYTYRNVLVDNETLYIIDFDYCTHDIRAYDIGRFIRKVAKHLQYRLNPLELILKSYQTISKLNTDELIFLLAFNHFPQRFWRLARRYYRGGSKYNPENLLKQLEHEIQFIPFETNFLVQFTSEISSGLLPGR